MKNPIGRPPKDFFEKENPVAIRLSIEFIEKIKERAKSEDMGWQSWVKSLIAKELNYPNLWKKVK